MKPAKCLLVDDREENLIALEALLAGEGLELYRARSGAEALDLLLMHEFALALIDVQMPGMNGFELAELMRGTARTRAIPIIFVTAGGPDHTRVFKGYEAGAVDFLFKPLSPHIVKSKVRVFVELYQQRETLKQQVEALRESQEITKNAVEARNRFISVAGHELRTPLTVLRLQLSMARRKFMQSPSELTTDTASQLLDQLDRQVERLVPLVDEMLDVSRIQSGKLQIRLERFDLSALVADVVERFEPLLSEAGCEATLDCPENAIGEWDRFRIEQVLSNLLSNAARYGGGHVRTGLRCEPEAVELRVSDQGPGIAEEDQQRIFQPFERADAVNGKAGLGLGLHIVRQIVEMHGGTIRVESEPGDGATFIVRLPRARAQRQRIKASP
jgi:signal transduction histidine kinase